MPRRARIHKRVGEAIEATQGRRAGPLPARAGLPLHARRADAGGRRGGDHLRAARGRAGDRRCWPTRRRPSTTPARSTCSGASSPTRSRAACELLLALGEARVRGGERASRLLGVPRSRRAGRAARRRRRAGPRGGRGLAALRAAAGRGRRRADRDDRARARARARAHAHAGAPADLPVRGDLLLARPRPDAGAQPGGDRHRRRARRPRGARVCVRRAAAGAVGRAASAGADRGVDRDAHAGAPDRQPRAPAAGACLARRRPARAGRPGRGRRPDGGVRGRRGPAAPAAVRVDVDHVAGDARCWPARSTAPTGWPPRRSPPGARPKR